MHSSSMANDERAGDDDGARDFDFLHGRWHVRNRRLRQPLAGSAEWYEFDATSEVRPLWNGRGNVEEWIGEMPEGQLCGMSLHLYDPAARQWRLHWATDRDGRLGAPTAGQFRNGRGEFFDHEDYHGRAILLRLRWEDHGPREARWEQAFSTDGGASWETNWTMQFTRVTEAS